MRVEVLGADEVRAALRKLGADLPKTIADGLNRTALAIERREKVAMNKDLDRPTSFTLNGIKRFKAYPNSLAAGIFVQKIQAEYLRYTIEGGRLNKTLVPIGLRTDQHGNIAGKRGGWKDIARKMKTAQIANRYGLKRGTKAYRRAATQSGLPSDMFVAEIKGTYGLWMRFDRPGRGKKARPPRLLVMLDRKTGRTKRWDFFGIGQRVAAERLPRDMRDAIDTAIRRL